MNYPLKNYNLDKDALNVYFIDYQHKNRERTILAIFILIALVFYVILFATDYVFKTKYRYINIENVSMQPTINPNPIDIDGKLYQDGVYISLTQDVDYGDIIIVDRSEEEKEENYTVIKRVMALEGDQISIVSLPVGENGKYELRFVRIKESDNIDTIVYQGVDDQYILYEDYILSYKEWTESNSYTNSNSHVQYEYEFYFNFLSNKQTTTHNIIVGEQSFQVEFFTVGSDKDNNDADQVFYMGDNRVNSKDSRLNGTGDQDKIIGKVIKIIRNGYSLQTSKWSWLEKVYAYLSIIWEEIINYFTV